MAYEPSVDGGLDYRPCRYGASKVLFRGPEKRLDGTHVAILGSTETYGKFVAEPYPELVERQLGRTCVNFGCINAGLDVFAGDLVVQQACADAALTVIQVMGAANMSNRFYSVHPRRNDRFVKASPALRDLYPMVDFAEVSFTRHLLRELQSADPARFDLVRAELREAWIARMRRLVRGIGGRVVLLWMSERAPDDDPATAEPLFVGRQMLDTVACDVLEVVEVSGQPFAQGGSKGMVFPPIQEPAARELPGPDIHQAVSRALTRCLQQHL